MISRISNTIQESSLQPSPLVTSIGLVGDTDKEKSSDIQEGLSIKLLLLCIEKSQVG